MLGWLRDTTVTLASFLLQGVGSVRENWGVGVLSIVLAVALWVFVTDQENPDVTGTVDGVAVEEVNLPSNQGVCSPESEVRVRVEAPESVLEDLGADDFMASVDLSGVTSQEADVPVDVVTDRSRVQIVDVLPSRVTVQLGIVTSETVPVEMNEIGGLPQGFATGDVAFQPPEAEVRGPACRVESVATLAADVNLTGITTTFQQTVLLQPRDQNDGPVQGLHVEPESAVVAVEVIQLESSRQLVVLPEITGTPAEGFVVVGLAVDPPTVEVSGPLEVFQALDPPTGIHTEAITIDGAQADVVRPVALLLPEGARVEQETITVRVIIQPLPSGTPASSAP